MSEYGTRFANRVARLLRRGVSSFSGGSSLPGCVRPDLRVRRPKKRRQAEANLVHPRSAGQWTFHVLGAGAHPPRGRGVRGDRKLWSECRFRRLFGSRPVVGGGLEHRSVWRKFRRRQFRQPRDGRCRRVLGVFRWHDVDRERRRRERQCGHRGVSDPPATVGHRRGRSGGRATDRPASPATGGAGPGGGVVDAVNWSVPSAPGFPAALGPAELPPAAEPLSGLPPLPPA